MGKTNDTAVIVGAYFVEQARHCHAIASRHCPHVIVGAYFTEQGRL